MVCDHGESGQYRYSKLMQQCSQMYKYVKAFFLMIADFFFHSKTLRQPNELYIDSN